MSGEHALNKQVVWGNGHYVWLGRSPSYRPVLQPLVLTAGIQIKQHLSLSLSPSNLRVQTSTHIISARGKDSFVNRAHNPPLSPLLFFKQILGGLDPIRDQRTAFGLKSVQNLNSFQYIAIYHFG